MRPQDKQILEVFITSSQKNMKRVISRFLHKHYKKVIETKEYVFAEGDIPIALVAHLDTVFEDSIHKESRELFYDESHNVAFCPQGAGFDDRAGIFAIVQIIRSGLKPHVIFTTDEEVGGLGASKLAELDCPFKDLKYVIELDRRGSNDCVFYDCENPKFTEYVESFGFEYNFGSYTDICEFCPTWKIAGVNLSIGYRDEHSVSEVLFVGRMYSTIEKVKKMLADAANLKEPFEYIPSPTRYNYAYGMDWYDWGSSAYGYGVSKCRQCKKYFMEEELFPVVMLDKTTAFFCPDCLVDHVSWCKECQSAYQKYSPEAPSEGICPICQDLKEKKTNVAINTNE